MVDFGQAELFEAEAIGEPGKRTFRLRVRRGSASASLWLEKEHLAALGLAIRRLLERTAGEEPPSQPDPSPPTGSFPEQAEVDFKIGRLGIGYDDATGLVTIFAYAQDEGTDAEPSLTCQVRRGQCRTFAKQAEDVVSAGRPICLLCGSPMSPEGHKCLRRNGHPQRPTSEP